MTTWLYAFGGLCFILVSAVMLLATLSGRNNKPWPTHAFEITFLVGCLGIGVWLAWPLALLVRDLLAGSTEARKLILARESARASWEQDSYVILLNATELVALLWAVSAPILWWRLHNADRDRKRSWALLVAVPIGYAVLVRWGVGAFSDSSIEMSVKSLLERNDVAWLTALYAEAFWLVAITASYSTGISIGPWTIFLIPFAVLPCGLPYYLGLPLWKVILYSLLGVGVGVLLNAVRAVEDRLERTRRDSRAREVERNVLGGDNNHHAFALYLRPFRSTGILDAQQVWGSADSLDFETILAAAVRPELLVVGLNRREDTQIVGVDRLYPSESDWWATFERMACAANTIFVLPAVGWTAEEIRWLHNQQLLSKCVFIMPETITDKGWHSGVVVPTTVSHLKYRTVDHTSEWATARQAILEIAGIALPSYQSKGALFTLHDDGRLKSAVPLHLAPRYAKARLTRKALRSVREIARR